MASTSNLELEDAAIEGETVNEIPHVEKLLHFFSSREIPYTTSQLSMELNITQHELHKTLNDLERLGYIHQMTILPGMEMVAPKKRLKSLNSHGVQVLKQKLNTLHPYHKPPPLR